MQGNLEFDIVSGSGVGHGTPDFDALSERSNYRRDSQSTVAGRPSWNTGRLAAGKVRHRKVRHQIGRFATKLEGLPQMSQ